MSNEERVEIRLDFQSFPIDIVFPFVIDYLKMKTLSVKSEWAEVEKVRTFLQGNLNELNISDEEYYQIEVSLLEVCINIIMYAYPEEKGEISLRTWQEEEKIFFEIIDWGIPFDPRKVKKPDIIENVKNQKRGGLGIFLSRKLMDGFDYKRENNKNILTMYKNIKEPGMSESV
ncbi:MAG: ATP-binding protein [Candidatus Aminicenantes bacterium]|nr:MAG: ATP-binding protein [Candidatus Aminicenantes bacterium]